MDGETKLANFVQKIETKFAVIETKIVNIESELCDWRRQKMYEKTFDDKAQMEKHKRSGESDRNIPIHHQFADSITSIVGLREAISTKHRPIQYAWTVLFCLGIGATLFYLYETTDAYLSHPTATNVQLNGEDGNRFPPMLLCPGVWFSAEKALSLGMTMNALEYSLSYAFDTRTFLSPQIDNIGASREEFFAVYARHKFESLLDYYKAILPDLEWNATDDVNVTSTVTCRGCESEKLEKTFLDQRMCYAFRLKPVEPGFGVYSSTRSISIKYAVKTLGVVADSLDWQLYFNSVPQALISIYPKVTVRAFYFNTIKFNEQRIIVLNKAQAPCSDVVDTEIYSSTNCMTTCHNRKYKKALDCELLRLSTATRRLQPRDACNHLEIVYPSRNWTLGEFFASDENDLIDNKAADKCVRKCPRKCDRTILDTTLQVQTSMSDASIGWNEDESLIDVSVKHGAVYQGGVVVFSEMGTYSFTQLVNNIGGTLGLFVGGTLMTFAQIILFAVEHFFGKNRKAKIGEESNAHT